jgi:uncharacterized membrane protein (DUF4010 family)
MEQTDLFYRFGAALAIGILVGLQREYAHYDPAREALAGVRTFALMALLGCSAALVSDTLQSPWVFISILFVLGLLVTAGYVALARQGGIGLTTEVAALLTAIAGALCYWDYLPLAAAIGVTTTVLLSLKLEMKSFVRRITAEDVRATLQFAVIAAIVLPVLPNRSLAAAPLDVLNPYRIWLMVVFISGISFLGYVLIKVAGPRQGIGLAGLLGGLVSSTAVTLSFSQRSKGRPELAKPLALGITVAWTIMFARVLVAVAVLNRPLLQVLWMPMAAAAVVGLAYCLFLLLFRRSTEEAAVDFSNPFELGPALKFGLLYAAILVLSRAAQMYLGSAGIYLSSLVSGLADMDAITLSMAQLSGASGSVELSTASRAIVLAAMSNTTVKGFIVLTSAGPRLRKAVLPAFLLILVTGIAVAFLV